MEFKDLIGNNVVVDSDIDIIWRPAVYGILIHNNKLLCITPSWDKLFSVPGGSMIPKESFSDALRREFLEETGYKIKIIDNNPFYTETGLFANLKEEIYFHRISFYFLVELESDKQIEIMDEETREIHWIPISSMNESDFTFFQRSTILKLKCT